MRVLGSGWILVRSGRGFGIVGTIAPISFSHTRDSETTIDYYSHSDILLGRLTATTGITSMIIKMQKHKNSLGYIVIEKVKNVVYEIYPRDFKNEAEFEEARISLPPDYVSYIHRDPKAGLPSTPTPERIQLNLVEYEEPNGRCVRNYFDGEAFICNDDGKTIQRIQGL